MIVGRKLKRNIFIDTDIDCQNCGCWQRVCTWNGECDNLEPMTNEEWLKSMNTEQLADTLAWIEDRGELPTVRKENVKAFEEWLKKPHGGES